MRAWVTNHFDKLCQPAGWLAWTACARLFDVPASHACWKSVGSFQLQVRHCSCWTCATDWSAPDLQFHWIAIPLYNHTWTGLFTESHGRMRPRGQIFTETQNTSLRKSVAAYNSWLQTVVKDLKPQHFCLNRAWQSAQRDCPVGQRSRSQRQKLRYTLSIIVTVILIKHQ